MIGDRSSFPLRGANGAPPPGLDCDCFDEGVFPVQQFEPGFDKFLFHQLRDDLVQLPSFSIKTVKKARNSSRDL